MKARLIGGPKDGAEIAVGASHPEVRVPVMSEIPIETWQESADFDPDSPPEYRVEVYRFHSRAGEVLYYIHEGVSAERAAARIQIEAMPWPDEIKG